MTAGIQDGPKDLATGTHALFRLLPSWARLVCAEVTGHVQGRVVHWSFCLGSASGWLHTLWGQPAAMYEDTQLAPRRGHTVRK